MAGEGGVGLGEVWAWGVDGRRGRVDARAGGTNFGSDFGTAWEAGWVRAGVVQAEEDGRARVEDRAGGMVVGSDWDAAEGALLAAAQEHEDGTA